MASLTPNKSPAHTGLQKLLSEAGLSVDTLRDLLWLIDAHDRLVSFPQICQNLDSILSALPLQWNTPLANWGLEEWPAILHWIVDYREELGTALGGAFDLRPKHPGDNTVVGRGSVRYPLYALLLNQHENPERVQDYRLLQAHLLIAQILTLRKFSSRNEYEQHGGTADWKGSPNSIYGAALAVRQLSEERDPLLRELFKSYPVTLPPTLFAKQLLKPRSESKTKGLDRHMEIARFLGKASLLLGWRRRSVSGRRGRGVGGKQWQKGYVAIGETVQEWPSVVDWDDANCGFGRPSEIRRLRHGKENKSSWSTWTIALGKSNPDGIYT